MPDRPGRTPHSLDNGAWDSLDSHPHNGNRTLRRLSKEAGVRSFGPHTGRYTNIPSWLRAGQPLEVVSAIASHATPSITLDACHDVLEDEKRTHTFDLRQHRANVVAHAQA